MYAFVPCKFGQVLATASDLSRLRTDRIQIASHRMPQSIRYSFMAIIQKNYGRQSAHRHGETVGAWLRARHRRHLTFRTVGSRFARLPQISAQNRNNYIVGRKQMVIMYARNVLTSTLNRAGCGTSNTQQPKHWTPAFTWKAS